MITITVKEMLGIVNNIMPKLMNSNYDAQTAFKVIRMVKAIRTEYEQVLSVQKMLLSKYGTPIPGQEGKFNIAEENQGKYNEEIAKLLQNKVEINAVKLPIKCLDGLEITPLQAMDGDAIFE